MNYWKFNEFVTFFSFWRDKGERCSSFSSFFSRGNSCSNKDRPWLTSAPQCITHRDLYSKYHNNTKYSVWEIDWNLRYDAQCYITPFALRHYRLFHPLCYNGVVCGTIHLIYIHCGVIHFRNMCKSNYLCYCNFVI